MFYVVNTMIAGHGLTTAGCEPAAFAFAQTK